MFHVVYRHKREDVWRKFGQRFENSEDCDLDVYRDRYPDYKFKLLFEPN